MTRICMFKKNIVYLLKLVDLSDKEISIATGNLGVCDMDHILMEDKVIFLVTALTKIIISSVKIFRTE